ncbi:MAG: hypothetical protein KKC71_11245 [Chloroflexi bacterium]|nr:hypothetical protein [Chloroflexota bacterium]
MENYRPALTLELDCDSALALLQICLNRQGFRSIHSFELASACASPSDPACPHHPGEVCECRLVTLTVYIDDIGSIPLVLHGHGYATEIYSVGPKPLPVVLEHCLNDARREELVIKSKL